MSDRPKDEQSEKRAAVDAQLVQRDAAVERMLSRRTDGRAAAQDCPDAEVIAAYLDRSLDADETARCEEHFADCSRCQEVLAALTASENVEAVAPEPVPASAPAPSPAAVRSPISAEPRRSVWQWLVPVAVAAAAIILWIDLRPKPTSAPSNSLQVATNAPSSSPGSISQPATPSPAGPGGESKTNQARPTNRQNDADALQVNGAMQKGAAAKKKQLGADDKASRSNAFGNSAPSPQVSEVLRDEAALEKSAISNTLPAPLPLPGQTSSQVPAAAQSAPVVGGAAGVSIQPPSVDGFLKSDNYRAQAQYSRQDQPAKEQSTTSGRRTPSKIGALSESVAVEAGATVLVTPTNGSMVWRIGPRGSIERSTDSGNTWQSTPAGVTADLLAGAAPANGVAWIVGKSGTILRTTDAGAHWTHPKSPTFGSEQAPDWSSVVATDADHATISSLTGQSFITTDGGATWSPQQQ